MADLLTIAAGEETPVDPFAAARMKHPGRSLLRLVIPWLEAECIVALGPEWSQLIQTEQTVEIQPTTPLRFKPRHSG